MSGAHGLRCLRCEAAYPLDPLFEGCARCATDDFRSGLTPVYDYGALRTELNGGPLREDAPGIWRYARLLPVVEPAHRISLGEGNTPIVDLPVVAEALGAGAVWLKDESRNPTWSFKDRHAAVTVGKALDHGARTVVVATSGNHGVSIAAYAARAGIRCVALSYEGLSLAARTLMEAYGAELTVAPTPEARWDAMRDGIERCGWYAAGTFTAIPTMHPYGHEGYKTIAFELFEQLHGVPDAVAVPTSYSEGLFGIWKGFAELVALGYTDRVPRMIACEPEGGPLALAHAKGSPITRVPRPRSVARGVTPSVNSYGGVVALRSSNGLVGQADDAGILAAQRELAHQGLYVEPASALVLAGVRSLYRRGELSPGQRIALVNTSSGLKAPGPQRRERSERSSAPPGRSPASRARRIASSAA